MDPDTIRSLRSRIRMDLLSCCKCGSMIPVDLSANCEGRIYDPNGSGIQIPGFRFRDPRTCLLTNVRDTIHADSLALLELNIAILLADVTKAEKSNILTLT